MTQISQKIQCFQKPSIQVFEPVIDWIDRELHETYHALRGRGGNRLLKLRRIFTQGSPNSVVGAFYRLLPHLEGTHFLLGFRIRQWLSLNFLAQVTDPLGRTPTTVFPILQTQRNLANLRRDFFETASVTIPPSDIRITLVQRA